MTRSDIIDQLQNFYREENCGHKGCKKREDCKEIRSREEKREIFGPKEPFIGLEYATGRLPRLVVLSSDPGRIDRSTKRCVFREESGTEIPSDRDKLRHWWRTKRIVYSIFGEKSMSEATDVVSIRVLY